MIGPWTCTARLPPCARPRWAPTTPTRSSAATTWPSPTQRPDGHPRRSSGLRRCSSSARPKLGPDHPDTLFSRNTLAVAYRMAGRLSEATVLLEGTLKLREAALGPDHPDTLKSRMNLAIAYEAVGRTSEAIALHKATLELRRPSSGPTTPTRSRAASAWPSPTRTAAGCPRRSR